MIDERQQKWIDNYQLYVQQQETYRFPAFSRDDVWELACDLIESNKDFPKQVAMEIYIGNTQMFRFLPGRTGTMQEMWLKKKRNTVLATGKSSVQVAAEMAMNEKTLADVIPGFPNPDDYAGVGGGFPLQTKDGCLFGTLCVSGLPDMQDHALIVDALDRFFRRRGWIA